jgi:hypothetical protein
VLEAIHQFLQEPNGVVFKKTAFFIATAVKTSNLEYLALDDGKII